MSLLVPDTGLLFWMTLSFTVVLVVLVRWGFPTILRAMDERGKRIASALDNARKAEEKLAEVGSEVAAILEKTRTERGTMLKETKALCDSMLETAKKDAGEQAAIHMAKAKTEIDELRRRTMNEAMAQIAVLSVKIAEKVVGENLKTDEQQRKYIDRLLKEEQENG